jgi:hypothetical protein
MIFVAIIRSSVCYRNRKPHGVRELIRARSMIRQQQCGLADDAWIGLYVKIVDQLELYQYIGQSCYARKVILTFA